MSPLDVIEIPGYPGWFARRCAVEAWQRAGSPPLVSAGRLYREQKWLYDQWRAGVPGFNPADNPDDETQRLAHVRMVAFDLKNPARDAAAMRAAGFVFPYSYEAWHGELPNVKSYAIVRSISAPAGINSKPIVSTPSPTKENEMALFLMSTSVNDDPKGPFFRWVCDPGAGTKRNIDQGEWDFLNKVLDIPEASPGIQPSNRLDSYRQIW